MKFLDIPITNIKTKKTSFLCDAINEYSNIILLGTPGSGKTSLLEQYDTNTNKTKTSFKITVKEFIKLNSDIDESTEILLLDGLDEYRSFEKDKSFVINELADKLQKYNCSKVISCRELDWYGDNDSKTLKDSLKEEFEIFKINLLDDNLQKEMIRFLNKAINPEELIGKIQFTGLLQNPQLLKMIVDVYQNDTELKNKKDIYENFIKIAGKEHNPKYNSININNDDIFKYNGYLAFFYMFSDNNIFNDDLFSEISNKQFNIETLKEVTKSKLYNKDTTFIHRTIAEYLCAKFIVDFKLNINNPSCKQRIKDIIITKHNKVISELRGVFSWIGVLSEDLSFIDIDPFFQLVYADNSFFNIEFKKSILLSIKKYANINPWFLGSHLSIDLKGFYVKELDNFLIDAFDNDINLKNHYLLLLSYIIGNAELISDTMNEYIKTKLFDNSISPYLKENLLNRFDDEYKKEILENVLTDKIEDNEYNTLKEDLISKLYPSALTIDELVSYMDIYSKSNMFGQCFYLYDTPFDDKYKLVDSLYKNFKDLVEYEGSLDLDKREPLNSIKYFIKDYFVELCLKYDDIYNAKEIFDILNHFHSFYDNYSPLEFDAYTLETKVKLKEKKDILEKLANDLFDIYIQDKALKGNVIFYEFDNIFSLENPTDKSNIFLSNLDKKYPNEINKELFWNAMQNKQSTKLENNFYDTAKEFELLDEIEKFLNPPKRMKQDWEIKYEEEDRERNIKFEKEKAGIKKHFDSLSDDDILNSFNNLKWVHYYVSQAKGMIDDTLRERFIDIFQLLLEQYLYKDEANIKEISLYIGKYREVDMIYYQALIVNKDNIDFDKLDDELKKYLYILSVKKEVVRNIDNSEKFTKLLDSNFKLETVKKVIKNILDDERLNKYIDSLTDEKSLETTIQFFDYNKHIQKSIIQNIVKIINFKISNDDLKYIFDTYGIDISELIFKIKSKTQLKQEELISFYTTLYRSDYYNDKFNLLDSEHKINIIINMIEIFNDDKMLKHNNGTQTNYDQTISFIRDRGFKILAIEELKTILEKIDPKSIWYNSILSELNDKSQNEANNFNKTNLETLKKLIINDDILNYKDFFENVCLRLSDIKIAIEDNRDNERDLFYVNGKAKTENECRDVIVGKLKDKYQDIIVSREQQEANNRADINIKYSKDTSFEIQVECKRDDNLEITRGVKNQLVDKYLSSNVLYGIYLVFYFGNKKGLELMIEKIKKEIPKEYEYNIKLVIIDLRLAQ